MDEAAVRRSMTRITHEIIEKNSGTSDLVLLGIHRRGMPLAAMLADNIRRFEGRDIPIGSIDISLYRDDLTELSDTHIMRTLCFLFDFYIYCYFFCASCVIAVAFCTYLYPDCIGSFLKFLPDCDFTCRSIHFKVFLILCFSHSGQLI